MELHRKKFTAFLATLLVFVFRFSAMAQTEISYSYDDFGNRISCNQSIEISPCVEKSSTPQKDSVQTDKFIVSRHEVADKIQINTRLSHGIGTVEFYSISGCFVKSVSIDSPISLVDISFLKRGVYVIRITVNNKFSKWKITKR